MINKIKENLKELGLTSNETKVYLSLTQLGESVASKIAKKSDLPRTTVISILEKLVISGYVSVHTYKSKNYYEIESPKTLQGAFSNKLSIAVDLEKDLRNLYRSEAVFPYANVYDTKKGIKSFIENLLNNLEKKSVIYTMDSPHHGNYAKVLGESFNNILVRTKKSKDIFTKTLIPAGSFELIEKSKLSGQNIKIKEMPKNINFSASVWFVGETVVFFSANPPFVVSIKHNLIVDSLKSIYDYLWVVSVDKN